MCLMSKNNPRLTYLQLPFCKQLQIGSKRVSNNMSGEPVNTGTPEHLQMALATEFYMQAMGLSPYICNIYGDKTLATANTNGGNGTFPPPYLFKQYIHNIGRVAVAV